MKFDDFVDAIYNAGWRNPNDAQSTNIRVLWEKIFPAYVEIERLEGQVKDLEDVVEMLDAMIEVIE